ncbi:MAG: hypothetical protein M1819_001518 [Sarea resinae]|nr:MAG: hypothetical protein M1819_001518 [Sarea resinae]
MAPKVLFILTSCDSYKYGGKDHPTGWYLPEYAHPYEVLAPHTEIVVASPAGGEAPLDQASVELFKEDPVSVQVLNTKQSTWKNTVPVKSLLGHAKEYEAIFFVGGHGPMFDLVKDSDSLALIKEFYSSNKIVAAVCHGPAALLHAQDSDGKSLIGSYPVTGFSNTEETQVGVLEQMPFSLEDELNKTSGGHYVKAADPWGEKVVVARDGRLITGQNPASAKGVGEAIYHGIFGDLTS